MATPNFLFGYQEHLLRSTFSGLFQTAQKYPCISNHWRLEILVSGDAQNVCAITIVGTVLKTFEIVDFARQKHRKFFKKETFHTLYKKSNNNNNTNRQNKSNNSNCEPFFNSRKVTVLATPCLEYKKLWYD